MTHAELVKHAERWLRNGFRVLPAFHKEPQRYRCGVVLAGFYGASWELPDAIGWFLCGGWSCLVECKASRSDFLADKRKTFRKFPDGGMGQFRYYMAPHGIIRPEELPDRWGLVEVVNARCRVAMLAQQHDEYCVRNEKALLYSALRRVQLSVQPVELRDGAGI